ncbi:MAG: hypothetical protein R3E78_04965 [Burkholderiaceae bacterium]
MKTWIACATAAVPINRVRIQRAARSMALVSSSKGFDRPFAGRDPAPGRVSRQIHKTYLAIDHIDTLGVPPLPCPVAP